MNLRALLLVLIVMPSLLAQTPAPATVSGILLRWGTEEPVGQATIELRSTSGNSSNAITATGDNGEFLFPNVAIGSYRIVAFADGYAPAEYGQLRQNGSGHSFTVAAGERTNLRMGIVPGAVLAGRVTNQSGQPMVYSIVEILKATYDASGQIITGLPLSVTTNDFGEYRAFWLAPGPYIVRAGSSQLNSFVNQGTINPMGTDLSRASTLITQSNRPRARTAPEEIAGSESGIAPVLSAYYGGAPDPKSAQVVELRAGVETSGIDIRIAPIQFTRRIRLNGVVVGPNGQPNTDNYILSIATWPEGRSTALASVRTLTARVPSTIPNTAPGAMVYVMDNGKFEGAASSGFYQIRASQGMNSGRVVVEASNHDLNVTIYLHAPSAITGRIQIEGETNANVDLTKLQVGIRTPPSSFFPNSIATNGQFRIDDLIDGDYELRVAHRDPSAATPAIENIYVKSIRLNGADALNNPIRIDGTQTVSGVEIVLGLHGGSVDGRAVNQRQESLDRATVVLLPQGPPPYREDRYRTVATDKSGQFQFRGLPPGEYRILAWQDIDSGAWFNPAFLAANEQYATAITLAEGKNQKMDVMAIPAGP